MSLDLALLKWGCYTLLKASRRLGLDDPLIPCWEEVVKNLIDYPFDEYGFMLGRDESSSINHQHFSNLLMIYPLYLANIEQEDTTDELKRSFDRARGTAGPGERQAMVQAHAGPIGTAIGLGDLALEGLKRLQSLVRYAFSRQFPRLGKISSSMICEQKGIFWSRQNARLVKPNGYGSKVWRANPAGSGLVSSERSVSRAIAR